MPSTTPLRGRRYPLEADSPDVASDIKNLALDLDTAPVTTQGIFSARPAAAVAGNRYYVTGDSTPANNNVEYIDTGSSWIVAPHLPIGALSMWAGSGDPVDHDGVTRWIVCDGRAISRTTFAALYSVLTTTYGTGDGSTTFNIPDLRGRVPVGADSGGVHLPVNHPALAASGGEEQHTLTTAELAAHSHGYGGHLPVSSSSWFYVIGAAASGSVGVPLENQPGSITDETATANAGSGSAHNTLQPYLAVNHIVRVL